MAILGLVCIGQTPRPDYVRVFRRYAKGAEIRMVGALDGLSHERVAELTAIQGDYPLLVRLSDGTTVEVDRSALLPFITRKVDQSGEDGARVVVILCAGGFPDIETSVPVLIPGRIIPALIKSVCRSRVIGVVTPIQGQVEAALHKWQQDGFHPRVTWASPHNKAEMAQAMKVMSDPSLEVVVLDCMGHDERYRVEFSAGCGRPTLLAQTLMARVAGEWVAG